MSSLWKMAHIWKGAASSESQHGEKGRRAEERQCHTVQFLTSPTMTILRIQRLLPAQLVLDLPAVAACSVPDLEVGIVVMHLVRGSVFPLIELAVHVGIIAIVAVGAVCRSMRRV